MKARTVAIRLGAVLLVILVILVAVVFGPDIASLWQGYSQSGGMETAPPAEKKHPVMGDFGNVGI